MDSRDMALRKEGDARGYYERCGAEAGIAGFTSIFRMFTEDETRHADALRALQDGARVELPASATLDGARRILRRLAVQEGVLSFTGDLGCYKSAMQFEAVSARACGKLAEEASGWERELFLRIAADDEIHFTLLEEMHELLQVYGEEPGGMCDAG
ncbi:ferritin-like domain protein [Citrifermentans bemidjiense Bem]|uniref:Ferritin-like domain protein n=1 Tax=Citrifermentans bemidjiense (strain ATCC BAA-1014 / DSM 16622 / JCM 12645 / Bem) TaxID=404380 RepID=B5E7Z1_CITBB|nr:ferritin [Citrifermentans bemidjiense]ACH38527.1 ferritin-like domain protein [Citrifermentans bemidjiense Bem]